MNDIITLYMPYSPVVSNLVYTGRDIRASALVATEAEK